jgi:hypothetical protein
MESPSELFAELTSAPFAGYRITGIAKGVVAPSGAMINAYYEKGGISSYNYKLVQIASGQEGQTYVTQGQSGYVPMWYFQSLSGNVLLFGKASDSTATYSYATVSFLDSNLLSRLNEFGAQGHCRLYGTFSSEFLIQRSVPTQSSCTYEAWASDNNPASFLAQLNAQGNRGYRLAAFAQVDGSPHRIYVKDARQSSTISYYVLDAPTLSAPATEGLALLNQQGAQGGRIFTNFTEGSVLKFIFARIHGCTGLECDVSYTLQHPFGL